MNLGWWPGPRLLFGFLRVTFSRGSEFSLFSSVSPCNGLLRSLSWPLGHGVHTSGQTEPGRFVLRRRAGDVAFSGACGRNVSGHRVQSIREIRPRPASVNVGSCGELTW